MNRTAWILVLALLPMMVSASDFAPDAELVYKTIGDVELKMHVFKPAGHQITDQVPAIVFFFGGGWSGGTPKQFYQQARELADLGMVAMSADYRVRSRHKTTPFEAVTDAKSAIRWVRQHAQELGIDPNRIVGSGGSAGGHVAACAGVIEDLEQDGENLSISSVPNALILFNPVLDTTARGLGLDRVGVDRQTEASPCHHVRPGLVPTIVFHGKADTTVPFENAERFTRLMEEAGNECKLVAFEGKGHGFFNSVFFRPKLKDPSDYEACMQESVAFLTQHGYLPCTQGTQFSVNSPDGKVMVKLNCSESKLSYSLSWQDQPLVEPSTISLLDQAEYSLMGVETRTIDQTWKPVWGSYSQIRDHCRQIMLKLDVSGLLMDLICQVYDDGIGFRFSAPAQPALEGKTLDYTLSCQASGDFEAYAPKGESEPFGPVRLSSLSSNRQARLKGSPVVLDTGRGPWLALLESDLYSARLFGAARFSVDDKSTVLAMSATATAHTGAFVTPWRVILVGNSPGDLLNSTVTLNLAAPCKLEETSWVKPGKGLWDWRIHGYDNGEFKYGIDTRSYLRIIDFAAEVGIDYLTIDDNWFTVGDDGMLITVPEVNIEKVMTYAQEKGVKVILYYDRHKAKGKKLIEDGALFSYYKGLGAAGLKYGFMGGNVAFTRAAIEGSAEKQLLIFFHDGPVPMTGVERTLPNLVSREYCHAQQDSRRAFSPSGFLKMAMINALTGPLDQANGNFGIKSINAGERMKGPRELNTYISTVVSEVARCLVISSGLVTLPDAPEEYRKKADLFEFLKQMPVTWDETRVINSQMGQYITTVRRTGKTWFVGSVNNESPRELKIALDFLTPDVTYEAMLFQDTAESHGIKNPEVYKIEKQTIKAVDTVMANMAMGGGHAMILRPTN
ncbi:glycoside hydrolase family 97 catalytic domain-containing protein [Planctomycetota bacterium]